MSNNQDITVAQLADILGALSNPNRLRLFLALLRCCPPRRAREGYCEESGDAVTAEGACVGELGEGLDIAPSTVSHHLKELRRVGLIQTSRAGQAVLCCVDEVALQRLRHCLESILTT